MHNKNVTHKFFEDSLHTSETMNRQLLKSIKKLKEMFITTQEPKSIIFDINLYLQQF